MMEDFGVQSALVGEQPIARGVNALFSDFGGNCRPLDLDFAAEDFLLGGNVDPQQEAWHRHAALTNIAAQGAAIRGMTGTSGPQPAWKAWSPSDDLRMDVEHSSGESLPSTSKINHQFRQQQPSSQPQQQQQQQQPHGLPGPLWQLPEVKAEASSSNPRLDLAERPKATARQAAQAERERERAEKLKEKNKRAQRKFRQRQKDKQESAERMAMDLSEQLQQMRLERDNLEKRTRELERALGDPRRDSSPHSSSQDQEASSEDREPTFVPANGWNVFDPMGGLILVATCTPPQKLTHRQMLSLSFRDVAKVLIELTRRLKECLAVLEAQPEHATAQARIQALLWERHAIMAYLAVNKPKFVYQVLSSKMVDPPETKFGLPPSTLWETVLKTVDLSDEQKHNLMEARVMYIRKVGKALMERQEIRRQIQELDIVPATIGSFSVATQHLRWSELVNSLKRNVDLCHRCHSYFMARVWYRDCFTPIQVAKIIAGVHPFPVDIFAVIKELVRQIGAPTYLQLLREEYGEEQITQATVALDSYVESWPEEIVAEGAVEAVRQLRRTNDEAPDTDIAKFSHRVPDDEFIRS